MDAERRRRLARLSHLGVPSAFQDSIAERSKPRGHLLMHAAIILTSIGLAVAAIVVWSRYVAGSAESAAQAAGARLYASDLGAESLGGLLTILLAAGWLCGWLTGRRGSETARNGTAHDLIHEPAKYKAITDGVWRWMMARHLPAARDANDFLDHLAGGWVRSLRLAALGSLIATSALAWMLPAHYSWATATKIEDHWLLPWSRNVLRPLAAVTSVTTGCPVLSRIGSTLIYDIHFADGTDADLGSWQALQGDPLTALEAIASHMPNGVANDRFSNPIGSAPLNPECLRQFGGERGSDRIARLLRVLCVTDVEKISLRGEI